MSYTDLVYSNARIKTLESNLLTEDKLNRIISSNNLLDAIKVLAELGYGNGFSLPNPNNYNDLLELENNKLIKLLKEVIPEKGGLEILLLDQDCKNLKSCFKLKYSKLAKKEDLLKESGLYNINDMYEQIMQDNYSMFCSHISKTLVEIDYEFALGQKRPAFIDYAIEKAINKMCIEILNKKGTKQLKKFYFAKIDFINFSSFLRAKQLKLNFKTLKEMLLDGGNIEISVFEKNYDQSYDQLQEIFRHKEAGKIYFNAINEIKENNSLITFEKEKDNYLISLFIDERNEIFSIAPIVTYYLQKKFEIKMVKLALVSVNNNIDKQEFRKRLRACFK